MNDLKLVYSEEFIEGVTETIEYIKKDSPQAAKIFERTVRKKIRLLKKFPKIGKILDDPRLKAIRILIIGNYLVLYEIISDEELIYLHAFCHGARDYPNIFKKICW
ncbi:MAG: type II toxin-antitoxin system RelE/ParE family toxin [bacterium]